MIDESTKLELLRAAYHMLGVFELEISNSFEGQLDLTITIRDSHATLYFDPRLKKLKLQIYLDNKND